LSRLHRVQIVISNVGDTATNSIFLSDAEQIFVINYG